MNKSLFLGWDPPFPFTGNQPSKDLVIAFSGEIWCFWMVSNFETNRRANRPLSVYFVCSLEFLTGTHGDCHMAFLRADRDDSLEGHLLWGKVTHWICPWAWLHSCLTSASLMEMSSAPENSPPRGRGFPNPTSLFVGRDPRNHLFQPPYLIDRKRSAVMGPGLLRRSW